MDIITSESILFLGREKEIVLHIDFEATEKRKIEFFGNPRAIILTATVLGDVSGISNA